MKKFPLFVPVIATFAVSVAAFGQGEEEPEEEPPPSQSYLPASVYPAVSVYGGAARGPSYDAAADITGRAAAVGLRETLEDVGTLSAFGVSFDFFFDGGFAASLKLTQEQAPRRKAVLKYDYSTFPKLPPPVRVSQPLEEHLAYKFQNVDYKIGLKYVPFPNWPMTPYGAGALGGNLTSMDVDDGVSDAVLEKTKGGALLTAGSFHQFSFDWALCAGVQINLGDSLFLFVEYDYDRQFREHEVADYKYRTDLQGLYAGAGWRFH